ncbi:MAG TPA: 2-phosphosulfolactate phosphatase [Acidimicrobiales bacterium]|nr:2-phosphosulfolactate phosphatase [Acidimicrobiales bacterium]
MHNAENTAGPGRHLRTDQVAEITGAVVVVDVIRAFSTAAYAFSAGARHIYLVAGVDDALAFKAARPGSVAMGEDHGLMPDGFDLPNSPVLAAAAELDGRTIVQRTSAGTQGVVAARHATRLWCANLVCASATARAVAASGLGTPSYVITGWFADRDDRPGTDDRLTAEHIDALRRGEHPDATVVAKAVAASEEATRTLALGAGHVDPRDIELATDVDRFAFALQVTRDTDGLRLDRVEV